MNYNTIGGTIVSALVGCNPFLSKRGAYYRLRGETPPTPVNEAMERGIRFEEPIAQYFAAAHPEFKVVHNTKGLTDDPERCHGDKEYITGSPDRLLYPASVTPETFMFTQPVAGLEIKTASIHTRNQWGAFGTDQVPQHYLVQCHWYMQFYNVDKWYLAVQFFNDEEKPLTYGEYVIHYDQQIIDYLRLEADKFWNTYVIPAVVPEDDAVDDTIVEYVKQKYPAETEPAREATTDEVELTKLYLEKRLQRDKANAEYESAKINLQMAIGDSSGLITPYGQLNWKKTKDRESVDWKAICYEMGVSDDMIKSHTKTTTGSRMWNDRNLKDEGYLV